MSNTLDAVGLANFEEADSSLSEQESIQQADEGHLQHQDNPRGGTETTERTLKCQRLDSSIPADLEEKTLRENISLEACFSE